jgi:parallel beta-helix repeat protein
MANLTSRFIIGLSLAAAVFIGCSSPTPNPIVPQSVFRDGVALNTTADYIPRSETPYILEEDWVIEAGRTVTIEPGTVIMVAGRNWIEINGKLIAQGTPTAPIHFTTAHSAPEYGQWRGLKFNNPDEASEIEYCIFTYGAFFDTDTLSDRGRDAQHYRGMLSIRNSSPVIRHCICYHNQNNGVYIEGESAAPTIQYCIFTDNDASGVRADSTVILPPAGLLDISYNCVAENSAPPFIMGVDSLLFGKYDTVNYNIDSCDHFFNIDLPPLLTDEGLILADAFNFSLQSCSPCINAGPFGAGIDDPEDMGTIAYAPGSAELRGRTTGTLNPVTYLLSCHIVIPENEELIIPAGARIETSGMYTIRVLGKIDIQGTVDNRVVISSVNDRWSGITFDDREGQPASTIRYADISDYEQIEVYKPGTVFEEVRFQNAFNFGMVIITGSLDQEGQTVLDHCEFINSGENAVWAAFSGVDIRNVMIDGAKGRGITLEYCHDAVNIQNTIVRACSTSALVMGNECSPTVVNNVFTSCSYYGMEASKNCYPVFANNIVTDNGRGGLYVYDATAPELGYNNVYHNGMRRGVDNLNYIVGGTGGSFLLPDEFSIISDPLFTPEYTLGSGSPCIDAGDPNILDPNGSRSDMGAFGGPGAGTVGQISNDSRPAFAVR